MRSAMVTVDVYRARLEIRHGENYQIDFPRTDGQVFECTMGRDGILEAAKRGRLVSLHSTIRPTTTKKVAQAAAETRVYVIAACMTAVPNAVRQGGLTFLVGGQKALFD